ncbi:ring-cleaving dioxygenase [Tengunoibacter tsumagoiensis]|nr:ring-cleaving dioxygenase [Tengunoibacter tsumagoiensis]
METEILGLHHISAITGNLSANIDFYTRVLGLRLVKVTVNFDDPSSYHLYYGDGVGHPGTILTFFVWPGADRGRLGVGQAALISFAIPQSAFGYWVNRFHELNITYQGPTRRFGEQTLVVRDPDGISIELVAYAGPLAQTSWEGSIIPAESAIHGYAGATLWEDDADATGHFLTEVMRFHKVAEEQQTLRYEIGLGGAGSRLDVRRASGFWGGTMGTGQIHHLAWRVATDDVQKQWREHLLKSEAEVTPILDRKYFHSIYFPEPGGVLFEIATDPPGFTVDEPVEQLGTRLQLPSWLEHEREEIVQELPPLPGRVQ